MSGTTRNCTFQKGNLVPAVMRPREEASHVTYRYIYTTAGFPKQMAVMPTRISGGKTGPRMDQQSTNINIFIKMCPGKKRMNWIGSFDKNVTQMKE